MKTWLILAATISSVDLNLAAKHVPEARQSRKSLAVYLVRGASMVVSLAITNWNEEQVNTEVSSNSLSFYFRHRLRCLVINMINKVVSPKHPEVID